MMRIVIFAGQTKRQIQGSYAVFGSHRDLRLLRDALNERLARENESEFSGWVPVYEPTLTIPTCEPEPWESQSERCDPSRTRKMEKVKV